MNQHRIGYEMSAANSIPNFHVRILIWEMSADSPQTNIRLWSNRFKFFADTMPWILWMSEKDENHDGAREVGPKIEAKVWKSWNDPLRITWKILWKIMRFKEVKRITEWKQLLEFRLKNVGVKGRWVMGEVLHKPNLYWKGAKKGWMVKKWYQKWKERRERIDQNKTILH